MHAELILRPAVPQDARAVADLWNGMIRETLATFTTDEKTPAEIGELIRTRSEAFWVAEVHEVLGFVTYGPFRSGPGYAATVEHSIILHADAQAKGVGRALMQLAQQCARAQGHHIMVAGISSANPGAVRFHEKLGFTQSAHMAEVGRKQGQWLDLILMQKTLHPS